MAFLSGEDDEHVLEAALSFVDDNLCDDTEGRTRPPSLSVINSSEVQNSATVSNIVPSFSIDCMAALGMVPLNNIKKLHIDAKSAGFQLGSSTKSIRPRKTNPNRTRDEVQFELVYLREQVEALEKKLQSLQLNASAVEQIAIPLNVLARPPQVWEEIAIRQKHRCDQAQHEMARLKVLVGRQKKMATSLCEMLRKRLQRQVGSRISGQDAIDQRPVQVLDFHGDIQDFQDLFLRLEVAFQEQEAVFTAIGLSDVYIPTDVVHVRKIDDMQAEVYASKILPFSLQDTGEAAWDYFKGIDKHLDNGGLYGKSMKNLDQPFTILEDFTKEVFSKNLRADVQAKQIVQRCVGPDRDMILFVSSMTPTEIKHKAVNGLAYRAQEYALTTRTPDSTVEDELSLLQLYTRISTECMPGVTFDSRYIRSVTRFWTGNVADNLRCYQERIENALVDRLLSSQTQRTHV